MRRRKKRSCRRIPFRERRLQRLEASDFIFQGVPEGAFEEFHIPPYCKRRQLNALQISKKKEEEKRREEHHADIFLKYEKKMKREEEMREIYTWHDGVGGCGNNPSGSHEPEDCEGWCGCPVGKARSRWDKRKGKRTRPLFGYPCRECGNDVVEEFYSELERNYKLPREERRIDVEKLL
jgi:hypothetical protein